MKLSDIKAGDTIIIDGGFTCAPAGPVQVYNHMGDLCFACSSGHHNLDGQENENGELIGISK